MKLKLNCLVGAVLALGLCAVSASAAPPYTHNTKNTTLDGILDALTDIQANPAPPAGTATAAGQATEATKLDTLHTDLTAVATAAAQATANASLSSIATSAGKIAGPSSAVPSSAVESCHVFKASPGTLYGFTVNTTASATANDWIMLFDATSAPADGAVTPKDWAGRISANGTAGYSIPGGVTFSTGIVACLSTTGPLTKTAEAQAVFSGKVQ